MDGYKILSVGVPISSNQSIFGMVPWSNETNANLEDSICRVRVLLILPNNISKILFLHPWVVLVVASLSSVTTRRPPRRHHRRRRHRHHHRRRRPSTLSSVPFSLASRLSSPQPSRAVVWVSCLVRLEIPDSRCISYRRVDADAKAIYPK